MDWIAFFKILDCLFTKYYYIEFEILDEEYLPDIFEDFIRSMPAPYDEELGSGSSNYAIRKIRISNFIHSDLSF